MRLIDTSTIETVFIALATGQFGLFLYLIWLGSGNGWSLLVNFNTYGEALVEVVFYLFMVILGILLLIPRFRRDG